MTTGFTQKSRPRRYKREDLCGIAFRSSWEANYARYLNWLILQGEVTSWRYEPKRFTFPVKRGCIDYLPDFEVTRPTGAVEYHEIKGWMDPKSRTKLARMKRYYPEVTVVLIDRKRYAAIARTMSRILEGWE